MNIDYVAEKLEDISKALGNIQELDKELALLKREVEELKEIVDKMPNTIEFLTTNNQEIDKVFRERFTRLMENYLRNPRVQKELEKVIDEKIEDNNKTRDAAKVVENNKMLGKVLGVIVTGLGTVLWFLIESGAIKIAIGG